MFSPSPFPQSHPRRSGRNTGLGSPAPSRRAGSSRAASRLGTPRVVSDRLAALEDVSMGSDGTNEMEVDLESSISRDSRTKGAVVFAKSEELNVALHAQIPVEVRQVLRSAGMLSLIHAGYVFVLYFIQISREMHTVVMWIPRQASV